MAVIGSPAPDLTDPLLYAEGDPHAAWHALRRTHPVVWHEPVGFWSVTGYAAAREVLSDWQRFSSVNGTGLRDDLSAPFPGGGKMLVLTDPPRHTVLRKAIARIFAPRAVRRLEAVARRETELLLRQAARLGRCDFATEVSARIPLSVSAGLLAVGQEDLAAMSAATMQAAAGGAGAQAGAAAAHHEIMLHYYRELVRREDTVTAEDTATDIVGAFLAAQRAGLPLEIEEILLTCDNIVVAAAETSVGAINGGLLAVLDTPGAWQALAAGADLTTAVEEVLRLTTPSTHLLRTAVSDTELCGVPIRAGDAVVVWTAAANRDPAEFAAPDELRLDRQPNPHLAFGAGVHFCLGAALARSILRGMLAALVALPQRPRRAGPVAYTASPAVWAVSSLPVEFHA